METRPEIVHKTTTIVKLTIAQLVHAALSDGDPLDACGELVGIEMDAVPIARDVLVTIRLQSDRSED